MRRRFRQPADSRVTARWPVVAGSIGLYASEGQFYRCPVPHPIPVPNKAIQPSRPAAGFFVPPCFPAQSSIFNVHISKLRTGRRKTFLPHLDQRTALAVPAPDFQSGEKPWTSEAAEKPEFFEGDGLHRLRKNPASVETSFSGSEPEGVPQ